MSESNFVFRNKFYKATTRAAMDNPLWPPLCQVFIQNLENDFSKAETLLKFWVTKGVQGF